MREQRVETLLEIAEDGIIDDQERPVYNEIMTDLREIVEAVLAISFTSEGQEKTPYRSANRQGVGAFGIHSNLANSVYSKYLKKSRKSREQLQKGANLMWLVAACLKIRSMQDEYCMQSRCRFVCSNNFRTGRLL